ncbi:MAG: hypothetical protein HeimC2_43600 [Candidatus Heimdallarchaeota archaeon LC_2]|nr:MAG: hypothetical protein HeimC2_43600 [Candidatus Heimdallarchaeota archaeon LC_2]
MGLFDFLSRFREQKEKGVSTSAAMNDVKKAAQASNYNQASIKAFYALESIGQNYAQINRDISTTAREYSQLLVDEGRASTEELEPIILNFEIAKYSPDEVTFDDYRDVETALDSIYMIYKKGKPAKSKKSAKAGKKKRKRPKKRATGARRRRSS